MPAEHDENNPVQDLSAYDTERSSPNKRISLELPPEGVPASLLVDSHALRVTLPVMTLPDTSSAPTLPLCLSPPPIATSVDTVNTTAAPVFDKHLYNS